METASPSSVQVIHDLSIMHPWVLRSTLATGFFEQLTEGPHPIEEFVEKLSADFTVFTQVIDYLAAIGYVQVNDEYVSLIDLGRALIQLLQDLYDFSSPMLIFDRAATELESAWSCGAQLVSAIEVELSSASSPGLDLGGSNGALARNPSEIHSERIGVLDLPEIQPNVRKNLSDFPGDRSSFHGSSFFDPIWADYDVYVLISILYGYSDQQVQRLLTSIHSSTPQHAMLVISEAVLAFPDTYTQAESNLISTLNTSGRSRSPEDLVATASTAGFRQTTCVYSSTERHTIAFEC